MDLAQRTAFLLILLVFLLGNPPAAAQNDTLRSTGPIVQDTTSVQIMLVQLIGNKTTRDRIIFRELVFAEGDKMLSDEMYSRLERSRQNLMNTGLFNVVTLLPVYIDQRSVIIEVTVNERWYLWPSVSFQLADPNFNTWWKTKDLSRINYGFFLNKYNFRGQNETIYVMAQFGYAQQYSFRYKVPYIDRKQQWGLSIGASYLQQGEVVAGTIDNERILIKDLFESNLDEQLADVELTLRRSHDVRHHWRLGFNQASVRDTVVTIAEEFFKGSSTHTRFLNFGYSLIWDRRDLRFFPRNGHFAELRFERMGLGILDKASPDISTIFVGLQKWWPLREKFTLALSFRGKTTFGQPPYYVQEGLGYTHQVRGYEYYVIDGEHYVHGRANLLFQLVKPRHFRIESVPVESFRTFYFALYLNFFSDAGYVWDDRYADRNFLANEWLNGHGVGLDLVTFYDQVVRAEYSINALGEHGLFLHFTQPF